MRILGDAVTSLTLSEDSFHLTLSTVTCKTVT